MSELSIDIFNNETTCKEKVVEQVDWSKVWDSSNTICAGDIVESLLFGLELTDSKGNPFPQKMFIQHMNSALSYISRQLGIEIIKKDIIEHHDYIASDYYNWGYLKLNKKPVKQVKSLVLKFGNSSMNIPLEWIKLDKMSGIIRLYPSSFSGAGTLAVLKDGTVLGMSSWNKAPLAWEVKYEAGFDKDEIPADLLECIQKQTACNVLNVWGDLILGAGIASSSISLDGLSQSVGTTQSAMFGGASARVNEYKENIKDLLDGLRQFYSGIQMVVV